MLNVTADQLATGAFQLTLFAAILNGLRRDYGWFMAPSAFQGSSVERGETSWRHLEFAYAIVSVNVIQIIVSSNVFPGWTAAIAFCDLVAMVYLFFFNGWFRNWTLRIVGLARSFKRKKDMHFDECVFVSLMA